MIKMTNIIPTKKNDKYNVLILAAQINRNIYIWSEKFKRELA
jgi:hypothetical protein